MIDSFTENERLSKEAEFFSDMVDAAIGLQNQEFRFTKSMNSKGQTSETLKNILHSTNDTKFPDLLDQFIHDANISVPEGLDAAKIVRRKRRLIESAGNVTSLIMKAVNNMTETLKESREYKELVKNITSMSEEERYNLTLKMGNTTEEKQNIQNIQQLAGLGNTNRVLFDPLLDGLAGALIGPFFSTLGTSVVPSLATPLLEAASDLLKILLNQYVDEIQNFTPLLKNIMMPIGGLVNELFNDASDVFMPDGYYTEVTDDWQLGFKKQEYSWNPTGTDSPNMCKKARDIFCTSDCETNIEYWNEIEERPGPKCNEFIFSQM